MISRIGKYLLICMLTISSIALAQSGISGASTITSAMSSLCQTAKQFLFVGAMLLVMLAAAVYAVGQILGAETRARASVWATAMLTGAVIGILIYALVPGIIGIMMGSGQTIAC